MDYTTMLLAAREMQQTLVPTRLENVLQTDDFTLLVQLRSLKDLHWLLLCWQPEAARVCSLSHASSSKETGGGGKKALAYSLPGQIKGTLQLKTLIRVCLPLPGERIMAFEFADRVTDTEASYKVRWMISFRFEPQRCGMLTWMTLMICRAVVYRDYGEEK